MFDVIKIKSDVVAWIRNYFDVSGKECRAVVGISGGKDSSVTAALCAEALGKERVLGVLLPCGVQYDMDVSLELVKFLGIEHIVINIKNSVDALIKSIGEAGVSLNRQANINAPARIRMSALYAVAASVNGRVANTCNLSEDWVGYSTKFGDGAGDFSLLARFTVTEVKLIGAALKLPPNIVYKVPEDGLSGKSDEDNLGFTYDVLDKYIREGECESPSIKKRIDALHEGSLHKLNPMPCFEF